MLLCSSCGTENQNHSKFCQNCGCSLEIQSSIVSVSKKNNGDAKSAVFSTMSREERFRRAKIAALKAIKDKESPDTQGNHSQVIFVGEKII